MKEVKVGRLGVGLEVTARLAEVVALLEEVGGRSLEVARGLRQRKNWGETDKLGFGLAPDGAGAP